MTGTTNGGSGKPWLAEGEPHDLTNAMGASLKGYPKCSINGRFSK